MPVTTAIANQRVEAGADAQMRRHLRLAVELYERLDKLGVLSTVSKRSLKDAC